MSPRARAIAALLLATVAAGGAAAAYASDRSAFLYSQGLEELRAARAATSPEERAASERLALDLFDRAVKADPSDLAALYYRGVTRGRVGDRDGAIADLQEVLRQRPGFDQAALELGIVLVAAGRDAEALPPLYQARAIERLAAPACFYTGIAELHLASQAPASEAAWLERARASFACASAPGAPFDVGAAPGAPSDLALPSRYYLGVIASRQGRADDARADLETVARERPGSDMGKAATEYLEGGGTPADLAYEACGFAKIEYDSNAVLAPSDTETRNALQISGEADGRVRLGVGGTIVPWRTDHLFLRLGYDFSQVLYFQLSEFDLQDHRPKVELVAESGPWQVGVAATYDYDLLEATSFLQQVSALPWLRFSEGDFGRTEVFYRGRWRDFYQQQYSAALDAWNHVASLQQLFYLDGSERFVFVGYRFDRNQGLYAQGDAFSYDGNEVNAGIGFDFPEAELETAIAWRYRNESFDPASGGRHDHENAVSVRLARALMAPHLFLTAEYFGTFHQSNQKPFEYDRNIGSLGVEVRF